MTVRAIRGATRLEQDSAAEMAEAVTELLGDIIEGNGLAADDLVSIFFTATPDIHSGFPAAAARLMGLTDVPLMCAQELDIAGAMPLVVRVLLHVNTDRSRAEIWHPYLRGTDSLRASAEAEG